MEMSEIGKSPAEKLMSLLAGKPIWVSWIVFTALSGVCFGVFYTAMYLLALKWWVAALVIIAFGMVWGSLAYTKNKRLHEAEKSTEA
ncbi:MAG: hypothetical protein CVV47_15395 [Spirochaetae bacterium HGW-Spirochaetae-3]|jgi:hypothetical protein|nr:MAG: hypothetical protein CVV47_15395 [Spirochaetae bacterium HGW-Spirochaetae-3]